MQYCCKSINAVAALLGGGLGSNCSIEPDIYGFIIVADLSFFVVLLSFLCCYYRQGSWRGLNGMTTFNLLQRLRVFKISQSVIPFGTSVVSYFV